jgi:hypothetical protein
MSDLKEMSDNLQAMVDAAQSEEPSKFKSAFETEVLDRISVAMDNRKVNISKELFDSKDSEESEE